MRADRSVGLHCASVLLVLPPLERLFVARPNRPIFVVFGYLSDLVVASPSSPSHFLLPCQWLLCVCGVFHGVLLSRSGLHCPITEVHVSKITDVREGREREKKKLFNYPLLQVSCTFVAPISAVFPLMATPTMYEEAPGLEGTENPPCPKTLPTLPSPAARGPDVGGGLPVLPALMLDAAHALVDFAQGAAQVAPPPMPLSEEQSLFVCPFRRLLRG